MTDLLSELKWRGFVSDATPALAAHLAKGPVTVYCGFDPTAASLQVGNLMPLMLLAHLQRGGHRPIVLMGGGTGLIGDPAGKRAERPLLSKEHLGEHLAKQRVQMGRFLDFEAGAAQARLMNNADWLVPLALVEFLRDVGKHFTINIMMQKESVKARLESGLSYTEFSYMLLQAYDFLHLYRHQGCTLQVGGSDQWGNITAGVDLIRRVENGEAHGLVAPLVTMATGQKFGKTESGAIWLDPALTSPYKFYQYWVNTDDRDVDGYVKLFTFLSKDEVAALSKAHEKNPAERQAQKKLAADLTDHVHGEHARQAAVAASAILFDNLDPTQVGSGAFDVLAQEIPTVAGENGLSLVDAVVRAGLAKSKSEARRGIEQGGIYVNQERVQDAERRIAAEDWIGGKNLLLRKGKKDYALLRLG